jgi:phosphohistidine phosphatase
LKRLILMRHAKSSWEGFESDHARPLNDRGRRDAPLVATRLGELGWEPDLVLLSDSRRTTETWMRMARRFPREPEQRATRALYLGGLGAIQAEIGAIPRPVRTLLALGHNPDWESAVGFWSGSAVHLTTANAALIELPDEPWEHLADRPGVGRLVTVLRPRDLLGG